MSANVFYNYQKYTSFIKADAEILESEYRLIRFSFRSQSILQHVTSFLKQKTMLLWYWNRYDVIVSQIAGYHTFIPSLLSYLKLKKHVIILHGTDCNIIKSINYGNLGKPVLDWFTRSSMKMATILLPVSQGLVLNTSEYLDIANSMGLKINIPLLKTPIQVIHNGVLLDYFSITNTIRPKKSFLTIALGLESERNYLLKGIDLILEIARMNPDYSFTIIGSESIYNLTKPLDNVKVIGRVEQKQLAAYYNNHKYYLQLSMSESFGLSLSEAMLCGCIPIVSDTGMMPEIIQDYGFVLKKRDATMLDELIHDMLSQSEFDNEDLMKARHMTISKRFDMMIRSEALLNVIQKLK